MQKDKRIGRRAVRSRDESQSTKTMSKVTLQQAFDMFFLAKSAEGLRKRTMTDYKNHHRYFIQWLSTAHPEIALVRHISPQTVREYINYLVHEKPLYEGHPYKSDVDKSRHGLSPACVNVRIATLKSFFRWIHSEGIIEINPTANIRKQAVEEDAIGAFTDDQIEILLAQPPKDTFAGFRDYVIMRLLLESGMRINEVLSLTHDNLDLAARLVTLKGGQSKNRRTRVIPLSADMSRLLMELISENQTFFGDTTHLFLANYGESLSQETITHRIKYYGQQAGIAHQVRCSPHTFRHTMAKNFLVAGGDIIALQRILGHSSMDMVRKYVQHSVDDLREAHDLYTVRLSSVARARSVKRPANIK